MQQDFHTRILMSNLTAVTEQDAQTEIQEGLNGDNYKEVDDRTKGKAPP